MHASTAGHCGLFAASAALTLLTLTAGAFANVGPLQDARPAALSGLAAPQHRAPPGQSAACTTRPPTKPVARVEPAGAPHPRRGPMLAALDDATLDALVVSTLSEEEAMLALERELSLKVGKHVREEDYPQEAQRWRWTGTALIAVLVGANGSVKDVSLGKTSGFRVLDEQALAVVRRVSKLFVPMRLRGRDIAVTIPVGFYLQNM